MVINISSLLCLLDQIFFIERVIKHNFERVSKIQLIDSIAKMTNVASW